jgi:tetratricopeptide (TPR) repeat protein
MLIEQAMTPSIIVDVPNARNIFQFRLSLTQQVFEDYLYYEGGSSHLSNRTPNELAHHYFEQIVEAGIQNEIPEVPVSRLIEHASKLGNAALQSLLVLMVRHFEELKSMCALDDIIEEYDKFRPKFQPFASSFEVVQLDLMYADALKKTDRQNGQIRANDILNRTRKMMRYLSEHETFAFIKDWCDIGYAGVNDQEILAEWKSQVLEEVPNLPDVSKWYVESYLLTTDRYLLRKDIAAELAVLVEHLRRSEKSLEQQYALGRILKETAVASWQEWGRANPNSTLEEQRSFFNSEIQPMFTEAIELMRTQNDFAGVAIAYGQEGDIHLNRLSQYPRAIELFEKDLKIVQDYHQINVESPTHNRLSASYLGHWKEQWAVISQQATPDENWNKAYDNVQSAIRVAKQREQKLNLNLIFALNHLTDVLMSREILRVSISTKQTFASFEEASSTLNVSWKVLLAELEEISEDILSIDWTMIRSDDFRSFLQGPWVAICADCPDVEWLQRLNQKLV